MVQELTCNVGTALTQNRPLPTCSPVLPFWRSCSELVAVLRTICIWTTVWTLLMWYIGPLVLYVVNCLLLLVPPIDSSIRSRPAKFIAGLIAAKGYILPCILFDSAPILRKIPWEWSRAFHLSLRSV
ncbi:hypothetical protein TNCV_1861781 [Trichonephila clavipes]|nr:hypothetical protein TNCV_1861781 [Trichonephila clavipes]